MPAKSEDLCQVSHCRNPVAFIYYKQGVCEKHWEKHCLPGRFNLKEELHIKEEAV